MCGGFCVLGIGILCGICRWGLITVVVGFGGCWGVTGGFGLIGTAGLGKGTRCRRRAGKSRAVWCLLVFWGSGLSSSWLVCAGAFSHLNIIKNYNHNISDSNFIHTFKQIFIKNIYKQFSKLCIRSSL